MQILAFSWCLLGTGESLTLAAETSSNSNDQTLILKASNSAVPVVNTVTVENGRSGPVKCQRGQKIAIISAKYTALHCPEANVLEGIGGMCDHKMSCRVRSEDHWGLAAPCGDRPLIIQYSCHGTSQYYISLGGQWQLN